MSGRSAEIAAALGGEARCVFPPRLAARRATLARYAISAAITLAYLVRRRPRAVIVTNPPIFPALIAAAYCAVARAPMALDSHPTAFGAKNHRVSQRLLPVHRWLARRAVAVIVTAPKWEAEVAEWGGRGLIVHEAPHPGVQALGPRGRERVALFVGTFGGDEPIDAVLSAARLLDRIELVVTGDPARARPGQLDDLPPNVTLTGFVPYDGYLDLLRRAAVVVTLTTEPTSIMRAAYEAVYAGRPLIVSDWPALREVFPYALPVANEPAAIAAAIAAAINDPAALDAAVPAARAEQAARWEQQRSRLAATLGLGSGP